MWLQEILLGDEFLVIITRMKMSPVNMRKLKTFLFMTLLFTILLQIKKYFYTD